MSILLTFVDSAMTICCFKGVDMTSCRIDYMCGPGLAAKHVSCTLECRYIPKIYFPVQRYQAGHNIKAIPEDKERSVPCSRLSLWIVEIVTVRFYYG